MDPLLYIASLFFLAAVIYSSVGFGGGSTYLALLLLFGYSYTSIPKIALLCNLIVVTGGIYHFLRSRQVSFRRIFPFVIPSIPMAYFAGTLSIDKTIFLILASVSLAVAGLRLLLPRDPFSNVRPATPKTIWITGLGLGGVLGFLSGLIGIGGGVFLAPLLYFLRWGTARDIAAMSTLFIFFNSLSGLAGHLSKGGIPLEVPLLLPLLIAVFLGGQIGSRLCVGKIPMIGIQRTTACLILFVAVRIFWMVL